MAMIPRLAACAAAAMIMVAGDASAAPSGVLREPDSAVRLAISDILAEQDRAWAAGDADAYAARALPEIVFTNVLGAYSVGKTPLLAQVRKIFSTIYKGSRARTSIVHIALIGKDVALVDTVSELRGFERPADPTIVVDGATYSRLQETMVRRQGGWWVASIHNVFIIPALVPRKTSRE